MDNFSRRRRQRFITEQYFCWLSEFLQESIERWTRLLPANGTEDSKRASAAWLRASARFERLLLCYTAGEPIAPLRDELERIVADYEEYAFFEAKEHGCPHWPAFLFDQLRDYERAVQLIGLCYLLHRRDLLPRVAALQDPSYSASDTLYEDLLAYGLDGRVDVDTWFHESYRDCINSVYGDSDEESLTDLNAYLAKWYDSMNDVDWHDSHLDLSEDWGLYFGYWAIEAAALAYLLELDDDSLREHLVYPNDLVQFARTFEEPSESLEASTGPKVVRTGQVCPETGMWKALGYHVPGVMVQQGKCMPEVFAPDKTGAYRMQSALWEFERKA
ncbi:PoNe immunity protein domain-containing protein [Burkholderia vietnamiensis]|uniref:PoNe immunity protein domain-containing protein n=1 Tax=Burkholderia vietnamiensis TaxID=60552 RepID=UPI00084192C0|nr:PoNe immunity protein domain-containing protein [Burkholderia vietnamiensis]MBR8160481.1 DUF1911 domain-containing protein [Burkholderia vietnamiensis]MCA8144589.1 DUF1911 domain-containing protein [Burkholderia vietnamiensis]HDR8946594.1 DUF1911 domain-containing protein [Burkholderia vietnamiensis]HDR9210723.1 DUF1911 domain-containing protein [Burkholderia vietnamiensis]